MAPNADYRNPSERIMFRLGTDRNPETFVMLQQSVNAAKGRLERFIRPISVANFRTRVRAAAQGDNLDVEAMFAPIRDVSGMVDSLQA